MKNGGKRWRGDLRENSLPLSPSDETGLIRPCVLVSDECPLASGGAGSTLEMSDCGLDTLPALSGLVGHGTCNASCNRFHKSIGFLPSGYVALGIWVVKLDSRILAGFAPFLHFGGRPLSDRCH